MSCVVYAEKTDNLKKLKRISNYLDYDLVTDFPKEGSYIGISDKGLYFIQDAINPTNPLSIDFLSGSMGWRIRRADHETLLKKTLGKIKEPIRIFDATAGLLSDAIIFLSLGHKVIACEQSKILYLLVLDACNRAKEDLPFLSNLELINGDSALIYKDYKDIDAVYLDPMYPESNKNALRAGSLNAIRDILNLEGIVDKADSLFEEFNNQDCKKIILKRPIKSQKICSNINYQIKGKTTRFDVYI